MEREEYKLEGWFNLLTWQREAGSNVVMVLECALT